MRKNDTIFFFMLRKRNDKRNINEKKHYIFHQLTLVFVVHAVFTWDLDCGVWGFLSIKSNEMLITTLKIKRDANALCRTIVVNNMNNHFMSVF